MKETDVRVSLDIILKSDETIHVDVRRAILEEVIDRFDDAMRNLKLPSGIKWDAFSIDGDASPGEDRKVIKKVWDDLAVVSRSVGQRPDPNRRG